MKSIGTEFSRSTGHTKAVMPGYMSGYMLSESSQRNVGGKERVRAGTEKTVPLGNSKYKFEIRASLLMVENDLKRDDLRVWISGRLWYWGDRVGGWALALIVHL
jgi:hypothetical protein